ncbi:MAG: tRNA (N(6)-L-threonylcarbamoyladenosine(37)-C(2))-methylthiotransferase MtaB [Candidatus Omnitrophota bacterium]
MTNTFRIKTLGCKVNQCDSQELRNYLSMRGWTECRNGEQAELAIVNTCCVTAQADRKSRQAVREAIVKTKESRVAVVGCYAGYERFRLEHMHSHLAIFDHTQRSNLFIWIDGLGRNVAGSDPTTPSGFHRHTRAFLKVQEGCDNRCSYCVVPLVRGPSRSRDTEDVLKEAAQMVGQGHREIVVTGVCLGAFGREKKPRISLVGLLQKLQEINGLSRIRLSSIEPADVTDELISCIAASNKICPHLHLSFQSGDDAILKAMNKPISVAGYICLVEKARESIKNLAITCDFIVGFPGEEGSHLEHTMRFIEAVGPLRTHLFTFSPRRGVSEFCSRATVKHQMVKKRFQHLKMICDEQAKKYMEQFLGKTLEVLFEEETDGVWQGYSQNYIRVKARATIGLKNSINSIKVTKVRRNHVEGEIIY